MELVRILTPSKLKNMHTLGQANTLVDNIYWLINKGIVETNDDDLEQMYPNKKSKVGLCQVKEYSHVHLHKDDTYRSNCFIKMIANWQSVIS